MGEAQRPREHMTVTVNGWSFAPEHRLTPGDVTQMFSITHETLRQWRRKGHLTSTQTPSGQNVYSAEQIQHIIAGCPWGTPGPAATAHAASPRATQTPARRRSRERALELVDSPHV